MVSIADQFARWYFDVSTTVDASEATWGLRGEAPGNAGPLLVGACVGLAVLFVIWLYRLEGAHLPRRTRLLLIALRTAVLLVLAAMLFQVRLVLVEYGRPLMAVLLDTSASMSLADDYPERDRQRLMQTLSPEIGEANGRTLPPRMELVRTALLKEDAAFLRDLDRRYEIEFYTFEEDATPLGQTPRRGDGGGRGKGDTGDGGTKGIRSIALSPLSPLSPRSPVLEDLIQLLETLPADGPRTNPRRSLEQVLQAHRGAPPVGMIVITDGNATDPEQGRLSLGARRAREAGTPLYVVGIGSGEGTSDVAIEQVRYESVAFADEPLHVEVTISGSIPADPKPDRPAADPARARPRTEVHIVRKGDETVLDSKPVDLPREDGTVGVSLLIPRIESGRNEFEVRVDPLPGESDLSNNQRTIRVWGRESQLTVLFVERAPRWEFRHLKTALERDRNVELRTFLVESDLAYAVEDRTAIARLPALADEIAEYDVILMGDVSWPSLEPKFVELLPRFVAQNGGGLLWLPGPRQHLFQNVPSVLRPLLPIELPDRFEPPPEGMSAWQLRRTPEGEGHPLLSPRNDLELDWEALPGIHAAPYDATLKEGSLVLLEGVLQNQRDQGTARNGRRTPSEAPRPMLVAMRYGAGQVLLQGFDETWRWRPTQEGTWYRQFWSQSVRFLAQRRILEQLPAWELVTDRDEYMADEPVHLRLLVNRPHEFPHEHPKVLISSADRTGRAPPRTEDNSSSERAGGAETGPRSGTDRLVPLARSERTPHAFEATLTGLPPGHYSAMLEPGLVDGPEETRALSAVEWVVTEIDRELKYRGMDRSDLRRAARETGGGFYELWELDRLRAELPQPRSGDSHWGRRQAREIPLWNRPEAILLATLLLLVEWGLRRRRGLE
jgi:hypothetical protein